MIKTIHLSLYLSLFHSYITVYSTFSETSYSFYCFVSFCFFLCHSSLSSFFFLVHLIRLFLLSSFILFIQQLLLIFFFPSAFFAFSLFAFYDPMLLYIIFISFLKPFIFLSYTFGLSLSPSFYFSCILLPSFPPQSQNFRFKFNSGKEVLICRLK